MNSLVKTMKTARLRMALASAAAMEPKAGFTNFMKAVCEMKSSNATSGGSSAGSYWLSSTILIWCCTNLAAVHLSLRIVSWSPTSLKAFFFLINSPPISPSSWRAGQVLSKKTPLKKSKSLADLKVPVPPWKRKTSWQALDPGGSSQHRVLQEAREHGHEGEEQLSQWSQGHRAQGHQ